MSDQMPMTTPLSDSVGASMASRSRTDRTGQMTAEPVQAEGAASGSEKQSSALFMHHLKQMLSPVVGGAPDTKLPEHGNVLPSAVNYGTVLRQSPAYMSESTLAESDTTELSPLVISPLTVIGVQLEEKTAARLTRPTGTVIPDVLVTASTQLPQQMGMTNSSAAQGMQLTADMLSADDLMAMHINPDLSDDQSGKTQTDAKSLSGLLSHAQVNSSETQSSPSSLLHTHILQGGAIRTETTALPIAQQNIQTTFGQPGWGQDIGRHVQWLVNQNIQVAELRLNPAHLGPIEVRISMDGDQANVIFSSQHTIVREALESAIPRLRELFNESNLSLANADISEQSFSEQRGNSASQGAEQQTDMSVAQTEALTTEDMLADGNNAYMNQGLLDYYV